MQSKIYVVASPLGNLEDLSPRAKRILEEVDLIACEDTRRTGQLLHSLNILNKKLISYYDGNEIKRAQELITQLKQGSQTLALVSDAGTPAIADPGYRLIKLAHEAQIPVLPIPGPSTLSSLISVSGLASDRVLFIGFLPRKKSEWEHELSTWKSSRASILAFESTNRIIDSLDVIAESFPKALICLGRELTKIYEEVRLFTIAEAKLWAREHTHLKGELALMLSLQIDEAGQEEDMWAPFLSKAKFLLGKGLSVKDTVEFFADEVPDKKTFYKKLHELP